MRQKIFVLVDALQFYVSCERSFQIALRNKPIIVAGNNDGRIVALSPEAKKLGLRRGQALFQCEKIICQHHVQVFSSNYALYDSMSRRLMALLAELSPRLEVHSIDEAFGELSGQGIEDLIAFGQQIRSRVLQWLGIPVRVSFAPSKVLAKIGSQLLKADESYNDVIDLTRWTEAQLCSTLKRLPVEDIYGIGPKSAQLLRNYDICNGQDFVDADEHWIKRRLTVVGARIQQELKGVSCFPLQPKRAPRKQIVYARSFGRPIIALEELEEAVSTYVARAAVRLRKQESLAGRVTVFVLSNPFDTTQPVYANEFTLDILYPTSFTPTLLEHAQRGARAIYREGLSLKRAGVVLSRILPLPAVQLDLYGEISLARYYWETQLMLTVDSINEIWGQDTVRFAAQGTEQPWRMRREHLSQRFTTRWSEILTV